MKKSCCGFGHREVLRNIEEQLYFAVKNAVNQNCELFYTGAMGAFDSLFSSAVRRAQKFYPNIKLICVKPYFSNDINTNRDYYSALFDDIIVPDELAFVYYKSAIKARNRWMIDNSDVVIFYTVRNFGGAYEAKKYALKQCKSIIEINIENNRLPLVITYFLLSGEN